MRFRLYTLSLAILFAIFVPALPKSVLAEINWQTWSDAAFQRAARDNKIIFVDVGTEWCSACNAMKAGSYQDPRVHKLLNAHFVAIHVDAEAEPDIGERYGFWGWPALVFMTPKGEHVHFVRGYMLPKDFVWLLNMLKERQTKGTLKPVDVAVDLRAKPATNPLDEIVKTARASLDRFYDSKNSGWGRPKMPFHDLVEQAIWRGHASKDTDWKTHALATARQTIKLMDPTWGGVFFGAFRPNWTGIIHERRTEHQASAMIIFARAYELTRDKMWLDQADRVTALLEGMLKSGPGTYVTSQEQEPAGDAEKLSPSDYFAKSDAERRAIGLPQIDTTVYADINAKVAIAYATLFEAGRKRDHLARALEVGEKLLAARDPAGWVRQLVKPPSHQARLRKLPSDINSHVYLRAQAFSGLAFLRLYRATTDTKWLDAAKQLADLMNSLLWYAPDEKSEKSGGPGYLASSRRVTMPTGQLIRDRPLVDNGAAAELLVRLATYGKGRFADGTVNKMRQRAEVALRSSSNPRFMRENDRFIGQFVFALHALRDEFIDVTVVCKDRTSEACQDLHRRALHDVLHIRKIVKIQKPGRYPDLGAPTAFVCTSRLCSDPIRADDGRAAEKMKAFMQRLDQLSRDSSG